MLYSVKLRSLFLISFQGAKIRHLLLIHKKSIPLLRKKIIFTCFDINQIFSENNCCKKSCGDDFSTATTNIYKTNIGTTPNNHNNLFLLFSKRKFNNFCLQVFVTNFNVDFGTNFGVFGFYVTQTDTYFKHWRHSS